MTMIVQTGTRTLAMAACVTACLGTACQSTEPRPVQYVFPQTLGVKWTYLRTDSLEKGNRSVRPPEIWAFRSLDDTVMSGMRWIQIDSLTEMLYNFGKSDTRLWIGQNSAGVYLTYRRVGPFDTARETELLLFKYPVRSGESGVDTDSIPWVVPTVDTLIQTPAGDFHCIRYDRPTVHETYFVARGVGIIRKTFISDGHTAGPWLVRGIVSLSAIDGVSP